MRILIITQWFEPEPTLKGLMFAKELQRLGHKVEVLTGFPNYPGGKVYPGYRIRPFQREVVEGVSVLRVPLYPSHDSSGIKRAANYLSYAASATVGALLLRRPDVAYVYHPPATAALSAVILRALKGVPFVYDIQDLWPDTLAATGMMQNAAVLAGVERYMQGVYRRAARISVLSGGFRDRLVGRGVPERKLEVIPNWAAEDQINLTPPSPQRVRELGFAGRFNVVFAGTMGKAQALDTVLDAAQLLQDDPRARFVMIGGGVEEERLKRSAAERALNNIEFLPRRPPSEIGEILSLADALLIHLKDDPLFDITVPGKTQANLRAGKPILMGVRGDAAQFVREGGAGLTFPPQDARALAEAIRTLMALSPHQRSTMGENGARYYEQHMALDVGVRKFAELLEIARVGSTAYLPYKRMLDILIASAALTTAAVPLALLALVIRRKLGSPVLFTQIRPGLYEQPFTIYKFRTMTDERDERGVLLPDARRLTPFGQFLRSASLDELPSLWNVLKGDMSIVGPRPLTMAYLPYYSDEHSLRHHVKPGVTGLSQVSGRNYLPFSRRLGLDVEYVRNLSFVADLNILVRTVSVVLSRDNVSKGESVAIVDDIGLGKDLGDEAFRET